MDLECRSCILSSYRLDDIEFQMNQRVCGGVRASTGEIGARWMPAPVELATIDHVRFPYANALGMLLAIRSGWHSTSTPITSPSRLRTS